MGARIRTRRAEMGLTQAQLAERANVSLRIVGSWERDELTGEGISDANLRALSDVLRVAPDFLLGLELEPAILESPEARYLQEHDRSAHTVFIGLSRLINENTRALNEQGEVADRRLVEVLGLLASLQRTVGELSEELERLRAHVSDGRSESGTRGRRDRP